MSAATEYLRNALLDHILNGVEFPSPASVYLSLHSDDPGDDGSNELSGSGYARVELTEAFAAPNDGITSNSGTISFPQASGAWSTVKYVGLWDASSGGNFLMRGALGEYRSIANGDVLRFNAGDLDLSVS